MARKFAVMGTAMTLDLNQINLELKDQSPEEVVRWGVDQSPQHSLVTTNFGPYEAAILHMVTRVKPDIQVLWADGGYGTPATYRFAEELIERLNLNMTVYTPQRTRARRDALNGGIPTLDEEEKHKQFTWEVKLEPFQRAMDEIKPEVWFTALRKEQTPYRATLDIASRGADGVLKISPVFHWTEIDLKRYLAENDLPDNQDYFDPTKVEANRECGLHAGYFEGKRAGNA